MQKINSHDLDGLYKILDEKIGKLSYASYDNVCTEVKLYNNTNTVFSLLTNLVSSIKNGTEYINIASVVPTEDPEYSFYGDEVLIKSSYIGDNEVIISIKTINHKVDDREVTDGSSKVSIDRYIILME